MKQKKDKKLNKVAEGERDEKRKTFLSAEVNEKQIKTTFIKI